MKRFSRILMQALILTTGLAFASVIRAEHVAGDSPPAVIELIDIYVRFKIKVFGLARVKGRFDRLRGELISAAEGEGSAVRMCIDVNIAPFPGCSRVFCLLHSFSR